MPRPRPARPIRLSAVADVVSSQGPSEIHRISQERVAIVSANLHYGDLGTAVTEVRQLIRDNPLAAGVTAHIGGQSEELDASVKSLIFALSLAIFLVYLVMASQFESLLHPFVIMFSIPLALVGAVLALKLTFTPLSVVVFIGLIMLAGIVVKNAIVLIDRVNQLREEGVDKINAIIQAAESRLRPISMTTLCTLLGFMPLAIGVGDGNEVRAPMAITVIGGLLVSTLLTLVVIPVVYDLLDRASRDRGATRERGRAQRSRAAMSTTLVAGASKERCTSHDILAELSLKRPVTVIMVFVSMTVIGLIAAFRLPLESMPDIQFPFLARQPAVPGFDAVGSRAHVTRPVEEALSTLTGVQRMNSVTRADGVNYRNAVQVGPGHGGQGGRGAREDRCDSRRSAGGSDALPGIQGFAPPTSRCCNLRISADHDLTNAYELLDRELKRPLERLPGVAQVKIEGVAPREVQIEIDSDRLSAAGVGLNDLYQRLQQCEFLRFRRPDQGRRHALPRAAGRRVAQRRRNPLACRSTTRVSSSATSPTSTSNPDG